jgi:ATP-binding cassette subfamily B protein
LQALRLVDQFKAQQNSLVRGEPVAPVLQAVCPSCKAPLELEQEECPVCTKVVHTPPSTWTLLRLWRFARPYRLQLFGGFFFMLMATFATLVPPYLTMPLMDEVLIPFQNGTPIDVNKVILYLGGLFCAALLAWVLGWAKTFLLALVSERIGSDLRTTTFNHLLGLSLEYFGGKRTGDLIRETRPGGRYRERHGDEFLIGAGPSNIDALGRLGPKGVGHTEGAESMTFDIAALQSRAHRRTTGINSGP